MFVFLIIVLYFIECGIITYGVYYNLTLFMYLLYFNDYGKCIIKILEDHINTQGHLLK